MPKSNPLVRASREAAKETINEAPKQATQEAPGWLRKGRPKQDPNKPQQQFRKFVPEFFLREKEKAVIHILGTIEDNERTVKRHQYPHFNKKGKRYFKGFTCTGDGSTCAGCANGDRAAARLPLLVIDTRELEYSEYNKETKKREKVKRSNVVKLWLPSMREYDNIVAGIEEARENSGIDGDTTIDTDNSTVRVTRLGSGTSTAYRFSVVKSGVELTDAQVKAVADFTKEFGTIFDVLKPLPMNEQREIVGTRNGAGPASNTPDDEKEYASEPVAEIADDGDDEVI